MKVSFYLIENVKANSKIKWNFVDFCHSGLLILLMIKSIEFDLKRCKKTNNKIRWNLNQVCQTTLSNFLSDKS